MCVHQSRVHAWVLDRTMRYARLLPYRQRVIGGASGRILEVGIGSGLNLPFYGAAAQRVIGLEPSPHLLAKTRERRHRAAAPVDLLEPLTFGLGNRGLSSTDCPENSKPSLP